MATRASRKGYMPRALLVRKDLQASDKVLYSVLLREEPRRRILRVFELMDWTGMSERTVHRAKTRLRRANLIYWEVEPASGCNGMTKGCVYRILQKIKDA